jgi:hypothetical protein
MKISKKDQVNKISSNQGCAVDCAKPDGTLGCCPYENGTCCGSNGLCWLVFLNISKYETTYYN